jgi:hypothetical protein
MYFKPGWDQLLAKKKNETLFRLFRMEYIRNHVPETLEEGHDSLFCYSHIEVYKSADGGW